MAEKRAAEKERRGNTYMTLVIILCCYLLIRWASNWYRTGRAMVPTPKKPVIETPDEEPDTVRPRSKKQR